MSHLILPSLKKKERKKERKNFGLPKIEVLM
jgi:hypothetical protein